MNAEELKQLKKGDEIFIRARYKKTYADGDVSFLHSNTNVYDVEIEMESYTHPKNVILPSELQPAPKDDPCRLFKKGDKVQPRAGRDVYACEWEDAVFHKLTGVYELESDEKEGHVTILDKETGIECYVSVFAVELVTPVEELEPYYVKDDGTHYVVGKRPEEPEIVYLAEYSKDRHPHAKEAAEAECARLNAEHRKEANNGNQ